MLLTGHCEFGSDRQMTPHGSGMGLIAAVLIMTCQDMMWTRRWLLAGIYGQACVLGPALGCRMEQAGSLDVDLRGLGNWASLGLESDGQ